MGRDKVLGLSLAILLIGFAAAFCFRNDKIVESGLNLARTKLLDEAIARRPGPKPYVADAKSERRKPASPSVTLQGVESVEPFSDLQPARSAESSRTTARSEKSADRKVPAFAANSSPAKLSAEPKPSDEPESPAETKPASLGPLTTVADAQSVSIDTDKAAPEIATSNSSTASRGASETTLSLPTASLSAKKSAAPAAAVVEGSTTSSEFLTSSAPPATDLPSTETQTTAAASTVRPGSTAAERSEPLVPQNVAWQTTPAQPRRDLLADNSPRRGSLSENLSTDEPARDNWKHEECTRDSSDERTPETPVAENSPLSEKTPVSEPTAKTPADESGTTLKPLETNAAPSGEGSAKMLTHRVRRGDTLSKMALHYLGNARRYREIFEANRDQLHTPNDRLKIGMTLHIPAETAHPDKAKKTVARRKRHSTHTSQAVMSSSRWHRASIHNVARVRETPPAGTNEAAPAAPADETNADKTNDDTPRSANRFVPVRRAPFIPGSSDADPSTPTQKSENTAPASDMSHLNIFPRTDAVRIAGDRDDAVIR
jgi:nucleoid-associated protein YgaU